MDDSKKMKLVLLCLGGFFSLVAIGLWIFANFLVTSMEVYCVLCGLVVASWVGFFCLGALAAIRAFEKFGSTLKYDKTE